MVCKVTGLYKGSKLEGMMCRKSGDFRYGGDSHRLRLNQHMAPLDQPASHHDFEHQHAEHDQQQPPPELRAGLVVGRIASHSFRIVGDLQSLLCQPLDFGRRQRVSWDSLRSKLTAKRSMGPAPAAERIS